MAKTATAAPTRSARIYGGKHSLEFFDKKGRKKHVYHLDGEDVPSVSRILDELDSPALIGWALNEMERALLESWQPGRSYDEAEIPELITRAKKARHETSGRAKHIGSIAHEWIASYISYFIGEEHNSPPELPKDPAARAACEAFLSWANGHDIIWLESERMVASHQHLFAGTLDFLAIIDGELVLGDLKTARGVYPDHWLQTAGYLLAWEEEEGYAKRSFRDEHSYDDEPRRSIDKRMILRLGKDPDIYGGIEFEVQTSTAHAEDCTAFLATLRLHLRMQQLKKFKGEDNGN